MGRAIMVQGTCSNAGKSFLCAGLCRLFAQDGLKVAPFKSQNMALNSFITRDGLEMGRAQAMQAEAAGVEPDVAMNPILLKPTSDQGSQVIVNGEVVGTMPAREYFSYKKRLFPVVRAAYERLAAKYDVVVIEGAGSPAEINLKKDDLVNMGIAKMAGAPVLLVGDIDRGGVFASLYGTVALLEPDERRRVKGFLLNKFRGDPSLLTTGLRQLEMLTQIRVLGVVPYLDLPLDDEDSLSPRLLQTQARGRLDAAVVRLPHLSNFTDFNALSAHPDIGLRYVSDVQTLGAPDLLFLPGTKNTMGDLAWLKQSGFSAAIAAYAKAGGLVFGICGGYQMLGLSLDDPDGVEGEGPAHADGLGLLPVRTVFSREKTRTRGEGQAAALPGVWAALSGSTFAGYEIHMGKTVPLAGAAAFSVLCGHEDGAVSGTVCGSYAHGLFDSGTLLDALVRLLCRRRGILPSGGKAPAWRIQKEAGYDALAAALRQALDLPRLYALL